MGIATIKDMLRKKRLGRFVNVMRRGKSHVTQGAVEQIVGGTRPRRPEIRWLDKIEHGLKELSAHVKDSQDRVK